VTTLQKFLMAMSALGAGYLVVSNPQGVAAAGSAFKNAVGGTISQIVTGGKKS
jgi:ribosomal protein S8